MIRKLRVFLSGPYTKPDPVVNVRRACLAADKLRAAGASVYVPHLSMLYRLVSPKPVDEWYAIDLEWLAACDGLMRLTGESVGADRECEVADQLGLPVFYGDDADGLPGELIGWIDQWRLRS